MKETSISSTGDSTEGLHLQKTYQQAIPSKQLIQELGFTPLHQLGQNFLINQNVAEKIIAAAAPTPDEAVVEIGPGTGMLTRLLAGHCHELLSIELDKGLAEFISNTYAQPFKVRVIHGDVLHQKNQLHPELMEFLLLQQTENRKVVFISNLPYAILTPLFWNLLEIPKLWHRACFMVQKEFHERLAEKPGSKRYSPMAAACSLALQSSQLMQISPNSFWPPPKVSSSVIQVQPLPTFNPPKGFYGFLQQCFQQRRKILMGMLKKMAPDYNTDALFQRHQLLPSIRSEQVPAHVFLEIYNEIHHED